MINLHPTDAIWLVPDEEVVPQFIKAVASVRDLYKRYFGAQIKGTAEESIEAAFRYGISFNEWEVSDIQCLLEFTFRGNELRLGDIDPSLRNLPVGYDAPLSQFFRMVFITLWSRKVFLAPLGIQTISNIPVLFDNLCEKLGIESLMAVRGVHPDSKLDSIFKREEFNNGSSRVSFWLRLLLSTTAYSVDDLSQDDAQDLFRSAYGKGELPLRRYYVTDFLLTLTAEDAAKRAMVEELVNQHQSEKQRNRVTRVYKGRRIRIKAKVKTDAERAHDVSFAVAKEIAAGERHFDFADVFRKYFPSFRLKAIFSVGEDDDHFPFYEESHPQVKKFAYVIDRLYKSFVKSKRLQKSGNHNFLLGVMQSYLLAYLPGFYIGRDSSLENYPTNLNDFNCTVFFTRESVFLSGVIKYEKQPPRTFLGYLQELSFVNKWTPETHYGRILILQEFCEYIELNNLVLPNANLFKCNFTQACYPAIERKSGTVKRPVPRPYFSTFLSMLYSLEYMVEHINNMPRYEGQNEIDINYGVLNGALYQPSMTELLHSHAWAGLLSRAVRGLDEVNQELLNYTPIFYYEGQIFTFKFLPRFYKIIDFEIRGELVKRISPNEVRLTQLMCETGLRQQHLIWLNKDHYDRVLDRYRKSPLAPLFVSSDKSHGEWTAIVRMSAIEIMDRQRKWYNSCSSPSYKDDLWYGMKEGSKFGQYKPLFRNSGDTDSAWFNHRHFPLFLLILQYFIRIEMEDDSGEDLVFIKAEKGCRTPFEEYTAEYLSKLAVNDLTSPHTPHGLRAGFVSEAMRFLPPSIVGEFMTGQSEALVWYYCVLEGDHLPDHQRLLTDYMLKAYDKLDKGDAPELAEAVIKLHSRLMESIEKDPVSAIRTHGLMSLMGGKDEKNGLGVLIAKTYTELAYNNTHICPFGNRCPRDVVEKLGPNSPCSLCPFAIRGVDHLPAVSAQKDKAKEVMKGVLAKLKEYRVLKPTTRNPQALENLNAEYDHHAREAYALEAVEQQLYSMAKNGDVKSFFLVEKQGLMAHFEKVELSEGEHIIKRLVDVQNFPDLSSPQFDAQCARMRMMMLVQEGKYDELFKVSERPESHQLASQISSMMTAGVLDVRDVMRISHASTHGSIQAKPTLSISASMGVV